MSHIMGRQRLLVLRTGQLQWRTIHGTVDSGDTAETARERINSRISLPEMARSEIGGLWTQEHTSPGSGRSLGPWPRYRSGEA